MRSPYNPDNFFNGEPAHGYRGNEVQQNAEMGSADDQYGGNDGLYYGATGSNSKTFRGPVLNSKQSTNPAFTSTRPSIFPPQKRQKFVTPRGHIYVRDFDDKPSTLSRSMMMPSSFNDFVTKIHILFPEHDIVEIRDDQGNLVTDFSQIISDGVYHVVFYKPFVEGLSLKPIIIDKVDGLGRRESIKLCNPSKEVLKSYRMQERDALRLQVEKEERNLTSTKNTLRSSPTKVTIRKEAPIRAKETRLTISSTTNSDGTPRSSGKYYGYRMAQNSRARVLPSDSNPSTFVTVDPPSTQRPARKSLGVSKRRPSLPPQTDQMKQSASSVKGKRPKSVVFAKQHRVVQGDGSTYETDLSDHFAHSAGGAQSGRFSLPAAGARPMSDTDGGDPDRFGYQRRLLNTGTLDPRSPAYHSAVSGMDGRSGGGVVPDNQAEALFRLQNETSGEPYGFDRRYDSDNVEGFHNSSSVETDTNLYSDTVFADSSEETYYEPRRQVPKPQSPDLPRTYAPVERVEPEKMPPNPMPKQPYKPFMYTEDPLIRSASPSSQQPRPKFYMSPAEERMNGDNARAPPTYQQLGVVGPDTSGEEDIVLRKVHPSQDGRGYYPPANKMNPTGCIIDYQNSSGGSFSEPPDRRRVSISNIPDFYD